MVIGIIVLVAVVWAAIKYLAKEFSWMVSAPVKGVKGTHKGIKGLKVKRLKAKRAKKIEKAAKKYIVAQAMSNPNVVANAKVAAIDEKIAKYK